MYGAVQHLLVTLARETLLVLFAEDVHWADLQSRDLLTFIARSVTRGGLLLILTTRPVVDVAAAAPIAELGQLANGRLVTLGPLDDDAVLAKIESGGADLPQRTRARIAELSEGVPLYIEELVAASRADLRPPPVLPAALRVNLAARATGMSISAVSAVRAMSVHEQPFTPVQAAQVLDGEAEPGVARALDECVHAGVLDALPHRLYQFHHALVRAAVAESLPPSVRTNWHQRWADSLLAGPTAALPETVAAVAHHLFSAGASAEGIHACVRAARTAERLGAPADAVVQWHRVLDMLDARPELAPQEQRDEALAAIRMDMGVDWPGVRRVVLGELARRPAATGVHGVFLWLLDVASARQLQLPDTPVPPLARVREAWLTLTVAKPSLMVAVAAENLVRVLVLHHPEEHELRAAALALLERSAAAAGSNRLSSMVEEWLAWIDAREGRSDAALQRMERLAAQEENDSAATVYFEALCVAFLADLGFLAESLRRGWLTVERIPHPSADASWAYLIFQLAYAHRLAGDWGRAAELHDRLAPTSSWLSESLSMKQERAVLAFDRGDLASALAFLDQMRTQLPSPEDSNIEVARWAGIPVVAALLAGHAGDGELAAAELTRVLSDGGLPAATADSWPAVVLAAQLAWRHPPPDPTWPAQVRAARDRMHRQGPVGYAWFHDVEANLARAEGHESADAWRRAVDAWHKVGAVHYESVCRLRLAEVLLAGVDLRQAAAGELTMALVAADRLGAVPLAEEIHAVAGRARLSVDPTDPRTVGRRASPSTAKTRPGPRHHGGLSDRGVGHLTARELEVLALLAEGRTNEQIGGLLYMSPKTASVHVSRIIDKLGAANRTQVVAIAHRDGLLQDPSAGRIGD